MIVDSVLPLPTLRGFRLTRTYGEGETTVTALEDVSLDLFQGQITLLMGPSGSGKSTLLAVLSGLLQPTHGEVFVQGEDLWKMSERRRESYRLDHFGFIFQGYNLFPALTALQQLEMVLRWGKGVPARQARMRALEVLGLLGMSKKAHLRPVEMSGGEKHAWPLVEL